MGSNRHFNEVRKQAFKDRSRATAKTAVGMLSAFVPMYGLVLMMLAEGRKMVRAVLHRHLGAVSASFRKAACSIAILAITVSQFGWAVGSAAADAEAGGPVHIRWFVGLGTGTDSSQVATEQQAVDDFNASQSDIILSLEVVPFASARDTLRNEITAGNAPDIVGPVGWNTASEFRGLWLDLSTLDSWATYDTSQFPTNLVDWYNTDEGQVGLPFLLYPAAMYYNPALFDAAGLNYPPAHYGDTYTLDSTPHTWDWDTLAQVSKRLTLDNTGKNSTEPGFDPAHIVQYGFSFGWETHPTHMGSYWQSGRMLAGTPGSYTADMPDAWKAALQWNYDGMWGSQRFIPNGPAAGSPDFGFGHVFNTGKLAMNIAPSWYVCCLSDLVSAGGTFQLGALPSYNGQVSGRVDADTFRVLSASKHPEEAFKALQYLVGPAGIDTLTPIYGSSSIPAIPSKRQAALDILSSQFPFVTQASWDVLVAGLDYPDDPSADSYMPHFTESSVRTQILSDFLLNTDSLNVADEIATLETDLQVIFDKKYTIAGNAGVPGAVLSYVDGGPKTVTADGNGDYTLKVASDWSGTVTPSKPGRTFKPASRAYHLVSQDWFGQYYAQVVSFTSTAAQDGWVLESGETTNTGGSLNSAAASFRLGDDAANRQYRAILSFNTATLPDNATITSALLKIHQSGAPGGSNPFNVLNALWADIRKGPFGGAALERNDFNAPASATAVGAFNKIPAGGWYTNTLNAGGRNNINKAGLTQLRLRFSLDDNNDAGADYLAFQSGNAASNKPVLVITYTLP